MDLNGVPFSITLTIDFISFETGGVYGDDPRDDNKLKMTREDVNEMLTQSLMEKGRYWSDQMDQRNRMINLLDLDDLK